MRWFCTLIGICAVALPDLGVAGHCVSSVAMDAPQFQAVVHQAAVMDLLESGGGKWRLPDEQELSCHLGCTLQTGKAGANPDGLYWVQAPDRRSRKFAWYLHIPSCKLLEYGDLVFPARLILLRGQ